MMIHMEEDKDLAVDYLITTGIIGVNQKGKIVILKRCLIKAKLEPSENVVIVDRKVHI